MHTRLWLVPMTWIVFLFFLRPFISAWTWTHVLFWWIFRKREREIHTVKEKIVNAAKWTAHKEFAAINLCRPNCSVHIRNIRSRCVTTTTSRVCSKYFWFVSTQTALFKFNADIFLSECFSFCESVCLCLPFAVCRLLFGVQQWDDADAMQMSHISTIPFQSAHYYGICRVPLTWHAINIHHWQPSEAIDCRIHVFVVFFYRLCRYYPFDWHSTYWHALCSRFATGKWIYDALHIRPWIWSVIFFSLLFWMRS